MIKLNILLSAVALLAGGSAMAGTLSPAAGDLPFGSDTVQASTLDRSTVAAEAAAQLPAAGEFNSAGLQQPFAGQLDRASVAADAAQWAPAAGEFSSTQRVSAHGQRIALGQASWTQAGTLRPAAGEHPLFDAPVAGGSQLSRAQVVAASDGMLPAAGQMNAVSMHQDSGPRLNRAEVRAEIQDLMPAAGES